ncbi:MAG: hypothetical protein ACOX1O_01255 [Eggerthellaceae bacterium]
MADETQHNEDGAPQPPEGSSPSPQAPENPEGSEHGTDLASTGHNASNGGQGELPAGDSGPQGSGDPGNGPSFSSPAAMVGWFCLGFFFGLIGLLITMLLVWRRDRATRNRAITYSCLGVIIELVLGTIAISMLGIDTSTMSMLSGSSSSSSSVW